LWTGKDIFKTNWGGGKRRRGKRPGEKKRKKRGGTGGEKSKIPAGQNELGPLPRPKDLEKKVGGGSGMGEDWGSPISNPENGRFGEHKDRKEANNQRGIPGTV